LAYPLQILRIAWRHKKAGMSARDAWLYGWTCTLCRFPNALGLARFVIGRLLGWNKNPYRELMTPASPPTESSPS
jgi:hypothetical protein